MRASQDWSSILEQSKYDSVYSWGFYFSLNKSHKYGVIWFGSDKPILDFERLANPSYDVVLKITLYFGFFTAYAVNSLIIPLYTWFPKIHEDITVYACF